MTWRERAAGLRTEIPAIALALKKRETPMAAKVLAAITVAYALSPLDLIPDFIPVLGYVDDLLLLPLLAALTVRLIPKAELEACRQEARGLWDRGKPKRWYFAVPIVLLWALALWLVLRRLPG